MRIFKKIKEQPEGVKASFAYFFASVVNSGIAYITMPIFTRLLTADQFGKVSVYQTWESVLGIIAMFCLSSGVFNNGMIDYKDDRDVYSFSLLVLSNIITIVFAFVFLCVYHWFPNIFGFSLPLVFVMFLCFFLQPAYNFWMARQRYEFKYKKLSLIMISVAILAPLCAIVGLLKIKGNPVNIRIITGKIPFILLYVVIYIYIIKKAHGHLKIAYWKSAFLFNLPLIPHYLSSLLLNSCDKIMISYMVGDSATAYYSVAHSVAAIATIVWSAANSSLIPYTYEKCEKKEYKAISKVTLPLLFLFGIACCLIILLAPEVVAVMATKDYQEAIYVIPPIVGGVFFQVQYFIYANIIYYFKKPRYVMYASVTSMMLNLILNYLFINKYGYLAAGYTTLICYFIQATLDYIGLKKVLKTPVYNMRVIGMLSLLMILISIISVILYRYNSLIRYVILFACAIISYVNRKKIIMIIRFKRN